MFINDKKKLSQVQEEFSSLYPYLKIEFYSESHDANEGTTEESHLDAEMTIESARTIHNKGEMKLDKDLKVGDLESEFFEKYGLNVQVFRKSGDLWLQTTKTDQWTLEEQNERGMAENELKNF
jgi:glycerol-3-phosphate O-acyltransferase